MSESPQKEESKVEGFKRASRFLRGGIGETLSGDATHFSDADVNLLKFHGIYEQDDRDVRHERRKQGLGEAFQFMVRLAIPAGLVTPDQYLVLDRLADTHGNGSLRITSRQGFQFHGVLKSKLKATIRGINDTLLTTLSACGDVERNVMACSAPLDDDAHVAIRRAAREIAVQLRPASRAYHEIWLNGDKAISTQDEEPFYGDSYLPRKFKTGIALHDDNCVDVYSYDAGLIGLIDGSSLKAYNVVVGGGMGMTHGKADTMAHLAQPLGRVDPENAVATVRTVAAMFRDHGNRADRRHARLKYLIADWGMERFRDEFRHRAPFELAPFEDMPSFSFCDHLGRQRQDDGRWFLGVYVENGRIIDGPNGNMKSAFRTICERYRPGLTLTAQQNILFTGLDEQTLEAIERGLLEHGVKPVEQLTQARRHSMACPALPTCGLAMADSERAMPGVVDTIQAEIDRLGLGRVPLTLRMTGCPNGCARPYTADIGFVGRRPGVYHVYVGGGVRGDRVADLYAADVALEKIPEALRPLLQSWAQHRGSDEGLGDYYQRLTGRVEVRTSITGREEATMATISLDVIP